MYAQISNTGIVLMVEDCYRNGKQHPLDELYHKDILWRCRRTSIHSRAGNTMVKPLSSHSF